MLKHRHSWWHMHRLRPTLANPILANPFLAIVFGQSNFGQSIFGPVHVCQSIFLCCSGWFWCGLVFCVVCFLLVCVVVCVCVCVAVCCSVLLLCVSVLLVCVVVCCSVLLCAVLLVWLLVWTTLRRPATVFILFSLSCWSFSLNFGGFFEDRDPQNVHV